mmetsp:Transcript_8316/g.11870  ORF Transcript_8316/g.11870 Transcript_8316/m.11870 type:complete len:94 (-) Transcript_8316:784-1065(-)
MMLVLLLISSVCQGNLNDNLKLCRVKVKIIFAGAYELFLLDPFSCLLETFSFKCVECDIHILDEKNWNIKSDEFCKQYKLNQFRIYPIFRSFI